MNTSVQTSPCQLSGRTLDKIGHTWKKVKDWVEGINRDSSVVAGDITSPSSQRDLSSMG
jgi:hypothetical protein